LGWIDRYRFADDAADYERHLLEPSRKVREDVEKEWVGKVEKLEARIESKTIWANRLDENFRAVSMENRELANVGFANGTECGSSR